MSLFLIKVRSLSEVIHGSVHNLPHCPVPAAYTGEAYGVEYLYTQTGFMFNPKNEDLEEKIDEGFGDEVLENSVEVDMHAENLATVAPPSDLESDEVRISILRMCCTWTYKLLYTPTAPRVLYSALRPHACDSNRKR